jgi:hypothetical protein
MWVVIQRQPKPDAPVWPGRTTLAAIDALAWPLAWCWVIATASVNVGITGRLFMAVCLVAAGSRLHRALMHNHRYAFTTWRWGRWLGLLLTLGLALKLVVWLMAR